MDLFLGTVAAGVRRALRPARPALVADRFDGERDGLVVGCALVARPPGRPPGGAAAAVRPCARRDQPAGGIGTGPKIWCMSKKGWQVYQTSAHSFTGVT